MAKPKVFISSTCYDLGIVRSELRPFIQGFGFDPIMSDHSDVLFDPKQHTHDSCVKELGSSDILILMIGSRLGGQALPSAKALLKFNEIEEEASSVSLIKMKERLSITQLETLKAIEMGIPVYAFVQGDVLRDHLLYEKNKDSEIIDRIEFPSIEKKETASYIFEFINFIKRRSINNSIFEFNNVEDIRNQLRSQWAHLFQRLLNERATSERARQEFRSVSSQIEDLKAVVLTSIGNDQLKSTAKGVLRFRFILDFLTSLRIENKRDSILSNIDWQKIIDLSGIKEIMHHYTNGSHRSDLLLIKEDRTFYRFRASINQFEKLQNDWDEFRRLDSIPKEAVYDAIIESQDSRPSMLLRYYAVPVDEYIEETSPSPDEEGSLGDILGEALKGAVQ